MLLSGSDSRFGDTAGNSYSYNLATVDSNVAAGQQLTVSFNTLLAGEAVTFDGSAETDGSFMTYGGLGTDVLTGGQQSDAFYFGADGRYGWGDRVDGQGGALDQLGLQGDYSGARAVTFAPDAMAGIEMIVLLSAGDNRFGGGSSDGFSYDIVMNDANVAEGARLFISANTLRADGSFAETLVFNGVAETNGSFTVYAGNGADVIVGGARSDEIWGRGGADLITGGLGADILRGGDGNDMFDYNALAESGPSAPEFDPRLHVRLGHDQHLRHRRRYAHRGRPGLHLHRLERLQRNRRRASRLAGRSELDRRRRRQRRRNRRFPDRNRPGDLGSHRRVGLPALALEHRAMPAGQGRKGLVGSGSR